MKEENGVACLGKGILIMICSIRESLTEASDIWIHFAGKIWRKCFRQRKLQIESSRSRKIVRISQHRVIAW
jgi:hypothetical protein